MSPSQPQFLDIKQQRIGFVQEAGESFERKRVDAMERNCKQQCARVGSSPPLVGFHPTRGKVIVSPPTIHQQLANLVHQLSPPKMTRYLIVKYISMKLGVLNHLLSSKR